MQTFLVDSLHRMIAMLTVLHMRTQSTTVFVPHTYLMGGWQLSFFARSKVRFKVIFYIIFFRWITAANTTSGRFGKKEVNPYIRMTSRQTVNQSQP